MWKPRKKWCVYYDGTAVQVFNAALLIHGALRDIFDITTNLRLTLKRVRFNFLGRKHSTSKRAERKSQQRTAEEQNDYSWRQNPTSRHVGTGRADQIIVLHSDPTNKVPEYVESYYISMLLE
ncbi:hypothetical protein KIN20_016935 [Parelaphostrongylus tenuis]|uniref:Uncharacterized protein n=1 Tax=Parelaphostrongylus tenuis TaxID=148309 RepID=A0AAD5QR36_PARTN|nr:hypothetical protein KIN20_016935 [Parelaphostrongylus tenuis]